MEIRSIKIDFDNDILEINRKKCERPTIVALPSDRIGWDIYKMFTPDNIPVPREECDRLKLTLESAVSNKL